MPETPGYALRRDASPRPTDDLMTQEGKQHPLEVSREIWVRENGFSSEVSKIRARHQSEDGNAGPKGWSSSFGFFNGRIIGPAEYPRPQIEGAQGRVTKATQDARTFCFAKNFQAASGQL